MKKQNKKKKGFTLIELIAVIAILAILGAILLPRIAGYQSKAKKSNYQTTAQTIVDAIKTYNSDKSGDLESQKIQSTTPVFGTDGAIDKVNKETGQKVIEDDPTKSAKFKAFQDAGATNITNVGILMQVAAGEFSLGSDGKIVINSDAHTYSIED